MNNNSCFMSDPVSEQAIERRNISVFWTDLIRGYSKILPCWNCGLPAKTATPRCPRNPSRHASVLTSARFAPHVPISLKMSVPIVAGGLCRDPSGRRKTGKMRIGWETIPPARLSNTIRSISRSTPVLGRLSSGFLRRNAEVRTKWGQAQRSA